MKKLLTVSLFVLLAALPTWAQTTASTSPTTGIGELLQQLKSMTPAERQAFVKSHPEIRDQVRAALLKRYDSLAPAQKQQFTENHPQLAQHLSNASQAGAGVTDPGHPRVNEVNQREGDQQQRITQGVNSGSLTTQQDTRLDKGEQRIQNQQASDLSKNDGHLTAAEQLRLNREQDRESGRIYADKHD